MLYLYLIHRSTLHFVMIRIKIHSIKYREFKFFGILLAELRQVIFILFAYNMMIRRIFKMSYTTVLNRLFI